MKKLLCLLLPALLIIVAIPFAVSAETSAAPTIKSACIIDEAAIKICVTFSEPVNIKNLGHVFIVNAYPESDGNGSWGQPDWTSYTYTGAVDKDGNMIDDGTVTVTSDNDYIYATGFITTFSAKAGSFPDDFNGILFKNLDDAGKLSTPDGRSVQGDANNQVYIPFTEPTVETEPKETEPKETEPKETEPKETEPKETEPKETEPKETEPKETEPKETEPKETEPKETEPKETEPKETKAEEQPAKTGDMLIAVSAMIAAVIVGVVLVKKH